MDNDVFERLKALQSILARKNELEAEIADAPKALTTREELLDSLKAGYIEKNSKYEHLRKNISLLKADLFEAEQKREKAEKSMDTIETQREYELLQKEIDEAGAKADSIRKEIQKNEGDFKILDTAIKQDEALINQNEEDLKESKIRMNTDIAECQAQLEELKREEENLSPGLTDETMFKFDRIIKNKQGVGIVSVRGNVCMGCHMILPAQFVNEVREENSGIQYCPYCSRILFYEESELTTGQDAFFDDSEMGGLADLDNISGNIFEESED